MADQSDVEQTLAALIASVFYPTGTAAPGADVPSTRIYRGWPDVALLAKDLSSGIVNVSISVDQANQANTTRFPNDWRVPAPFASTLQAAVAGNTVVFAGDAGPGQIAGILVDGFAGVHRTVAGDTPATVAAALAATLVSRDAMASGSSVLVLGARNMVARVVADQPGFRETRRQRQVFRIACWCSSPSSRDTTAAAIDEVLADTPFLSLPDGSAGRLRHVSSLPTDRAQAAALYRRDLLYTVDYATTVSIGLPTLLFGGSRVTAGGGLIETHLS